jgi:transposase
MGKLVTDDHVLMLRQAHRKIKDRNKADRIKAVLLLNDGFSYPEVAKILLLDDTTIRRYEVEFQERKIKGLLESRYTGGTARLTVLQQEEVRAYFTEHTPQTAKAAVAHIKKSMASVIQ